MTTLADHVAFHESRMAAVDAHYRANPSEASAVSLARAGDDFYDRLAADMEHAHGRPPIIAGMTISQAATILAARGATSEERATAAAIIDSEIIAA